TALISAARNGAIEPVRLLLERGANVDIAVPVTRFDGTREVRTALNQAQANDHDEIVALLVAHGAVR
ncbi:MAG: ankyrin repeat domain-containing protein, partial [Gammaproteobacteria bacterium]